ncbi:MAG: flotillin-like FloA family protein [Gemmataceae bacterium]
MDQPALFLLIFVFVSTLMVGGFLLLSFVLVFRSWLVGLLSGAPVRVLDIVGMRLRGNPPRLIVEAYATLRHRGVQVTVAQVESAYIAHKGKIFDSTRLADRVEKQARPQEPARPD